MKYSYSINKEDWFGSFDSPEEAAWAGMTASFAEDEYDREDNGVPRFVWVCENESPSMACPVDGESVIDGLLCQDDFSIEAAENFHVSKEEMNDLTVRVRDAWEDWIRFNNIEPRFFIVKNMRKWQMAMKNANGENLANLDHCGILTMVQSPK